MIDRRSILTGAAVLAASSLAAATAAQAPAPAGAPPAKPPAPTREERLTKRAADTRRRLDFAAGRFSGPGYDWLLAQGKAAHFFLLGEEHGIAENPKLAAQLFAGLVPSGYSRAAIEISPPMAREIDSVLAGGGVSALGPFLRDPRSTVAFFGMREEAEWLAAARRALPGSTPFLWGLDYEVGADRHLISLLKARPKPAAAEAALSALDAASQASWAKFAETRNPAFMYSFAGDPALVRAIRSAWPRADARSAGILETLEETFAINRLWVENRPWESNARRAEFLRRNFLRHWREESRGARDPRVFMKFGASHLQRGRNSTETFDLGTLVPEIAEIEGKKAFSLLVLPGPGREVAAFNPSTYRYSPQKADGSAYMKGLQPLLTAADPGAFTLFETAPLRPLLGYSSKPADPDLMRAVHGFDAILVMSGSTPSTGL